MAASEVDFDCTRFSAGVDFLLRPGKCIAHEYGDAAAALVSVATYDVVSDDCGQEIVGAQLCFLYTHYVDTVLSHQVG
jgi:hypothetical protein